MGACCDEPTLAAELTELCDAPPDAAALRRARTLFAHALETPGGLKIQTIHAFCESVLHRFPLEAGVPFDFEVLEEHERDALLLEAREAVLAGGLSGDPQVAEAVETLFELFSAIASSTRRSSRRSARRESCGRSSRDRDARQGQPPARSSATRPHARSEIEAADDRRAADGTRARSADLLAAGPRQGASSDKLRALNPIYPSARNLLDAFLTQDRTVAARR